MPPVSSSRRRSSTTPRWTSSCSARSPTASTCRKGSPTSATTVVDPRCRVLHVVDASIFPTCPRANPNLVAIAAAELMADRLVR
ncbi:GMC oxidoreductase [Saccharopolyspora sp. NPDC000359]|uniref:GMC oxidoreductase n=1 Tax=Saccharopolyspora sp. NPDC000359 TaxID=3154251 RepID=UPI003331C2ED